MKNSRIVQERVTRETCYKPKKWIRTLICGEMSEISSVDFREHQCHERIPICPTPFLMSLGEIKTKPNRLPSYVVRGHCTESKIK